MSYFPGEIYPTYLYRIQKLENYKILIKLIVICAMRKAQESEIMKDETKQESIERLIDYELETIDCAKTQEQIDKSRDIYEKLTEIRELLKN